MPNYKVTLANADFRSLAEHEFVDDTQAISDTVRGAISIGAEEICRGAALFIAEIKIERDGNCVARRAVAVGLSPLSG